MASSTSTLNTDCAILYVQVRTAVGSVAKDEFVSSRGSELEAELDTLLAPMSEDTVLRWQQAAAPVDPRTGWPGIQSELLPPYEFGEFAITNFILKFYFTNYLECFGQL